MKAEKLPIAEWPRAQACINDVAVFMKEVKTPMDVMWSYKLDGVRTVARVQMDGAVQYVSRNGGIYPNFKKFDKPLYEAALRLVASIPDGGTTWNHWPVEFDGEVMPKSGNGDSLAKVMCQLRRIRDIDDSVFLFNVFDMIPCAADANLTQFDRYQLVSEALGESGLGDVVYHKHFFGPELMSGGGAVAALMAHAVKEGYEGLVLKNAKGLYEGKRSKNWCKVKPSDTMDLRVVGFEPGGGKHAGRVGALMCEMPDGQKVSVGTGLDDTERYEFAHHCNDDEPMNAIGPDGSRWVMNLPETIEVGYQQITKAGVLRFPTFIRIREDK